MIDLDHIALTVDNLDESIFFYTKLGYTIIEKFYDEEYNWATLKLNNHSLELFEVNENYDHIAYSYDNEDEVIKLLKCLGYNQEELDIFYGDLNRKSFFIKDINGKSIQLIKK